MRLFDPDSWQEIFSTLKKNKLRTFFTAFGVFWGIFMLIIMLGSGTGLRNGVNSGFGDMATNSMFIWTQRTTEAYKGFPRGRFYNFNNTDTQALIDNIPEIEYIAPRIRGHSRTGDNNTVRGERTGSFRIQGDYPEYNLIDPVEIISGRFINKLDIEYKRKNIVIGERVFQELFDRDEDPIGQYIRVSGVYFKVVGMFRSKKGDRQAEFENQQICMPFTTLQLTYNYGDVVGWYSITATPNVSVSVVEEKAKDLLRKRHSISPTDERAIGSANVEEEFNKMTNLFRGINGLIWIVGIGTLLAGIVGVSNIMMIIVKERTQEIGIQRAIGATPFDITKQVITESVFLTAIAGYVGLVIGVGIIEAVNYALIQMQVSSDMFTNPSVDFDVAIKALLVLIVSGALAGLIPARRAVSIKPIDALRDE
ncbi:MAG: multidrug ABC transporter ATP-binding protein [Bacteroidetes bacterium 4484_276]|nr:MAG: multidrug ABC transporter ATP-binding protein [Bacteroidetes bacterium 4484_276]